MVVQHEEDVLSQGSSGTNSAAGTQGFNDEKLSDSPRLKEDSGEDGYDNLDYPPAWKFEKYFIGGYSQKRMLKFKKPKSMYIAINLFAGNLIPNPFITCQTC